MILLMNIGNTNTWIAKLEEGKITQNRKIETRLNYKNNLDFTDVKHLYISSLVPAKLEEVLCLIKDYEFLDYTIITSHMAKYLKDGAYDLDQLGVDRMLVCDAAIKKHGKNLLVCDLGTATSLNYIDEDYKLAGGLILPGLDMGIRSLHENTGLLPKTCKDGRVSLNAQNTEDSIRSGIILSQVYTIERYAQEHDAKLILTGGNSFYLKDYLKMDYHFEQYLLLEGLVNFVEK